MLLESFPYLPHASAVLEAILNESVVEELGGYGLVDWFLVVLEDDAFEETGVVEVHFCLFLEQVEGLFEEVVALLDVVGYQGKGGLNWGWLTTEYVRGYWWFILQ